MVFLIFFLFTKFLPTQWITGMFFFALLWGFWMFSVCFYIKHYILTTYCQKRLVLTYWCCQSPASKKESTKITENVRQIWRGPRRSYLTLEAPHDTVKGSILFGAIWNVPVLLTSDGIFIC